MYIFLSFIDIFHSVMFEVLRVLLHRDVGFLYNTVCSDSKTSETVMSEHAVECDRINNFLA